MTATSAAIETCVSARLACAAWASASLAFSALRLAPNTSGSQLASKPALNRLPASLPPDLLRWADPAAFRVGASLAALTSRSALACSSAACAERTVVLACRAWLTSWVSRGSLKRCHHCAREVAGPGVLALPDQAAGSGVCGSAPPWGASEAQPDSSAASASAGTPVGRIASQGGKAFMGRQHQTSA